MFKLLINYLQTYYLSCSVIHPNYSGLSSLQYEFENLAVEYLLVSLHRTTLTKENITIESNAAMPYGNLPPIFVLLVL